MGIGRKTKRAKNAHIKRVHETQDAHDARLKKQIAYKNEKLSNETQAEREERLTKQLVYEKKKL